MAVVALLSCKGGEARKTESSGEPGPAVAPKVVPPLKPGDLLSDLKTKNALPARGGVQVDEIGEHSVKLSYMCDGATLDETKAVTTGLITATIDALIARGLNPRVHRTAIVAEAYASVGQSVTGAERVVALGRARYDVGTDAVSFEEAKGAPFSAKPSLADSPKDEAQRVVRAYAQEAFPAWSRAHPGKACPARLDELNQYVGRADALDPWGRPYLMLCGDALPAGSPPIAVASDGPDKKPATVDDVRSWE